MKNWLKFCFYWAAKLSFVKLFATEVEVEDIEKHYHQTKSNFFYKFNNDFDYLN